MAKLTASREEVEHLASVRKDIGDLYPPPKLKVRTKDGVEHSGKVVRFQSSMPSFDTYSGSVTLQTGEGEVEIDYLDIGTVERLSTN